MKKSIMCLTAILVLASACTERQYEPIIDAPKTAAYHSDLAACRKLASTKKPGEQELAEGAFFGGLTGAAYNGVEGAIVGVIIGGVIGANEDKNDLVRTRNRIVQRCLTGRGYKLIG